MSTMRVIIEVRDTGAVYRVERDAQSDNWLNEDRNNAERRKGVIDAANGILRSLNLGEIEEAA